MGVSMFLKLKKSNFILGIAIGLLSVVSYFRIFSGFFQQDEWLAFARTILLSKEGFKGLVSYAFFPSVAHWVPLTQFSVYFLFTIFDLNYQSYAIISLLLHFVSVVLVFYLSRLIFKTRFLAALSSLLFGIMAVGFQANAWVLADTSVHAATILGLFSVICFFLFLQRKEGKLFILSLVSLVASLLFKEITVGLFLLLPLAFYLFSDAKLAGELKYPRWVMTVGVLYIIFRGLMFLPLQSSNSFSLSTSSHSHRFAYNIFTIPLKAVSQTFIPASHLRSVAEVVTSYLPGVWTGEVGTTAYEVSMLEKVLEPISLLTFVVFLFLMIIVVKSSKNSHFKKVTIFGFVWIIINTIIFAYAPERSGIIHIIDSRNLYFVSIGGSFVLVSLASLLVNGNIKKIVILLLPIFLLNIFWLERELSIVVERGKVRKVILNQIKKSYPDLPERVVFYTQSDTSYYGLAPEEKILPFQSGFGQTLLIWYYPTETFSKEFYEDRFLWNIKDQGYKEIGERGFGYFRDFDLLRNVVEQYSISLDSVIAFSWENETQALLDITEQVCQKVTDGK